MVSTKKTASQTSLVDGWDLFNKFWKQSMAEEIMYLEEIFLV